MKSGAAGLPLSKMLASVSGTQVVVNSGADWVSHMAMPNQNAGCSMKLNVPPVPSWLGGVTGLRVSPLGTDRFGQTGDLPDLYRAYRLDAEAIIDAAAELFLDA